jgi:hypothetical protein
VYLPTERDTGMDPVLAGIFNRPDYISPLDDLAFDMYQDPEVAQIIRKLEKKKQEAVLRELRIFLLKYVRKMWSCNFSVLKILNFPTNS